MYKMPKVVGYIMTIKTVYKLTNQDMTTYGGFKWEIGKWYQVSGSGPLCSDGWLHAYSSPEIAILLNPIHANIKNPRLWKVEADGAELDDKGLKSGHEYLRLIRELPVIEITTNQRVAFAIYCALQVFYKDKRFKRWADNWLSGKDRSSAAAYAAAYAAAAAAAADAASYDAAYAAFAAARAAAAADAAADAAYAAARAAAAADAAADAAYAAADAAAINFQELAEKAMKIQ